MKHLIVLIISSTIFYSCDTAKGLPGASTSLQNSIQNRVHVLSYKSSKGQYDIEEVWLEKWWFYGSWGRVERYLASPQNGYYQILLKFNKKIDLENKTILLKGRKTYFTPMTDGMYICSLTDGLIPDSIQCYIVEGDCFNVLNENRLRLDSFSLIKK